MGVDLGGLKEVEDMKTRMILSLKKCEGEPNYKDVVGNSMISVKTENRKNREKLVKLLMDMKDRLGQVTEEISNEIVSGQECDVIKGFLESERTIQNLDLDINNKLGALRRDACSIFVHGESFSGKSSILNLLLGEEVVPTFFRRYSSTILRICYYKQRGAKIIYENGKVEKIKNIPPGETYSKLEPFLIDNSDGYRKPIRECGLILIESARDGETDETGQVILKFVNENQIDGFLYVIKADNANGVEEERE
ncbi:unnamed protein product [Mytilus coruscus]|uniref:Uncharacterized protein n=1 Tax=Mytilus coruscus TaxID=42192 RepID=A0A6J8DPU4_MYTCO|nr:unnamed protein product [Mytilus coruscus]